MNVLLDNYTSFEKEATQFVANWRNIDKNELFRRCVDCEADKKVYGAYFSAIACRYWAKIMCLYRQSQPVFSQENCYDWYMNALLYTLKHHKWTDPNSVLFNDPKGPDKAFNICLKSERLTAYQASNRYKRKGNALAVSIEQQAEDFEDYYTSEELIDNPDDITSDDFRDLVTSAFNVKDYMKAFVIDIILNSDVFMFTANENGLFSQMSVKRLLHIVRTLNDTYFRQFSKMYNIDINKVRKAYTYCNNLTTDVYVGKLNRIFKELRKQLRRRL